MKKILLLLILSIFSTNLYAQEVETESEEYIKAQVEEEKRNAELEGLKSDLSKKRKEVADAKSDLAKKKEKYVKLNLDSLAAKRVEVETRIAEIGNRSYELTVLTEEARKRIAELEQKKSELEQIRNNEVEARINKYRPMLGRLLSILIDGKTIETIKEDCAKYRDSEEMLAFLTEVDQISTCIKIYIDAKRSLELEYDQKILDEKIDSLVIIKEQLSTEQAAEIDELIGTLRKFTEGVKVLQDYFAMLNDGRKGDYIETSDIEATIEFIEDETMKSRLNMFVYPIPYLNNALNEFKRAVLSNPKSHPAIERKILGY